MVRHDLRGHGIRDRRVLEAMATVPRECFVRPEYARSAYDDRALPIEESQTISQPYIVARTAEALALTGGERVLDVGAGSGYAAAVLSCLAEEVWAVERHGRLVEQARLNLDAAGIDGVHVVHGDGTAGLPAEAPFDAVAVAAASPEVPSALIDQLVDGGRVVIPIGPEHGDQMLVRLTRRGDHVERDDLLPVRFVPLVPESR